MSKMKPKSRAQLIRELGNHVAYLSDSMRRPGPVSIVRGYLERVVRNLGRAADLMADDNNEAQSEALVAAAKEIGRIDCDIACADCAADVVGFLIRRAREICPLSGDEVTGGGTTAGCATKADKKRTSDD